MRELCKNPRCASGRCLVSRHYAMLWMLVGLSVVVPGVAVLAGCTCAVADDRRGSAPWAPPRSSSGWLTATAALVGLVVLAAADLGIYGLSYSGVWPVRNR